MALDRSVMPAPRPEPVFTPPMPVRRTLSNGLSVLVVEKLNLPMVALGFVIPIGAATDPAGKDGLTSLTATMLQEGTSSRSSQQIAEEMEEMGSALRIEVARENLVISVEVLESQWQNAFEIMSDVVRNAVFPQHDLDRIRRQRLTDLARIADNPTSIARRVARALLYGVDSTNGHPTTGSIQSVESLTRTDLSNHYMERFGPTGSTIVASGQVSVKALSDLAERLLGDWQPQTILPQLEVLKTSGPDTGGDAIYIADKPGAAQSVIRSAQTLIGRHHRDFMPLVMLNQVFGGEFSSRLNMNLRQDKGYSYGYMSSIGWAKNQSALFAGGSVQTDVTSESVLETLNEYSAIRSYRPVEDSEFDDAVTGLLRGFPSRFESQSQISAQLAGLVSFDLPDKYLQDYPSLVKTVSLQDVRRVAVDHLEEMPKIVLVVGDREKIEPGLSRLGHPIVLVDIDGRLIG